MDSVIPKPVLLVDFDGTISCRDSELHVAGLILGEAGHSELSQLVEAYEHLEIGIKDYYRSYFRLMELSPAQWRQLAATVPLRDGFCDFVALCHRHGVELRILSEGLDLFILPLLEQLGLGALALSCNRVVWNGAGPVVLPALDAEPCSRCLNCKGAHARRHRFEGRRVGLVGNGASDLCAAREADLVFARDHLARLCQEKGIPFILWKQFSDIRFEMGFGV